MKMKQHHQLRDREVLHQRELRGGAREAERPGVPALQRQHAGVPLHPQRGPAVHHVRHAHARYVCIWAYKVMV